MMMFKDIQDFMLGEISSLKLWLRFRAWQIYRGTAAI